MKDLEAIPAGPVAREQIARYADAVDDHNPIHLDEDFARRAGMPSVIAHGPLCLALAIDALVAANGAKGLQSFDGRLRAPLLPDQSLTVSAHGENLEVKTVDGDTVVATATVRVRDDS